MTTMRRTNRSLLLASMLIGAASVTLPNPGTAQDTATVRVPRPTRTGNAARWAARVTPYTAVSFGLLLAGAAPILCESEPCAGTLQSFVGGLVMGTVLGAGAGGLLGLVLFDPGAAPAPGSRPASDGLYLGLDAGLTDALESAGYGSCAHPQSEATLRGRVGGRVRPRLDGFLELSTVQFEDNGCEGQGRRVEQRSIDEDARSTSVQVGMARVLDDRRRYTLEGGIGVARTTRWTREAGAATGPTRTDSSLGVHVSAGARAGWSPELGDRLRMGVSLRGDWIMASPMGAIPLLTLSVGFWR